MKAHAIPTYYCESCGNSMYIEMDFTSVMCVDFHCKQFNKRWVLPPASLVSLEPYATQTSNPVEAFIESSNRAIETQEANTQKDSFRMRGKHSL